MTKRFKTSLYAIFFGMLAIAGFVCSNVVADPTSTSGTFYNIEVSTAKKNDKMVATIAVTGKNDYHCNMLYPWKLTVKPKPGVTFEKQTYKKEDAKTFSEKVVVFEVIYTAELGKKASANLKMSLCNAKQCDMAKVDLTW
jgi:hypothetical protein